MSASPTTVPAVKAKLVELFKAAAEEPTEVWPQRPNAEHQLLENVYLGETRGQREFKSLPVGLSNSRQENYEVQVEIEVYRQGADPEGTETRMWVVAQAMELAVANNPTLSLANVQWGVSGRFAQSTKAVNDGVLASYSFGVSVVARI